jgi:hypothetical protein
MAIRRYVSVLACDEWTELAVKHGDSSVELSSLNKSRNNMNIIKLQVFTAVTMKNIVFWDIKTQFVLHRRHITTPLQSSAG